MTDRERLKKIEECYRPTVSTHHHYLLGGIPVADVHWLIETLKKYMDRDDAIIGEDMRKIHEKE